MSQDVAARGGQLEALLERKRGADAGPLMSDGVGCASGIADFLI